MGFRQFSPYILTFEEQANAVWPHEILGVAQKLGQGRQSPCCHHIKVARGQVFQPGIPDGHRHRHPLCGQLEEGALLGGRLIQGDGQVRPHRRQNQAGESGPGTQIGQSASDERDLGGKLGTIPKMPLPKVGQGAFGHQIVPGIPIHQDVGISL
jgi:hypothetical protein